MDLCELKDSLVYIDGACLKTNDQQKQPNNNKNSSTVRNQIQTYSLYLKYLDPCILGG